MPKAYKAGPDRCRRNNNNKGRLMNKQRLIITALLSSMFLILSARAEIHLSSVGILEADSVKKFGGMHQHGVILSYRLTSRSTSKWTPRTLDWSAGQFQLGAESASFISFGPVYRFDIFNRNPGQWFIDFGVRPTYVSDSGFGGQSLGGNVFFTSYVGLGAFLDGQHRTSLFVRYQHTSNAGLSTANPGVDMLALAFSYYFDHDQPHASIVEAAYK